MKLEFPLSTTLLEANKHTTLLAIGKEILPCTPCPFRVRNGTPPALRPAAQSLRATGGGVYKGLQWDRKQTPGL